MQMPPKRPSINFLCVVCMCVGFFVCGLQEGAACVCTWPTALLKLRSLHIEKEREV